MNRTPKSILLLTPLLLQSVSGIAADKKEESPNLIIIMADEWRGMALGSLGTEPVLTPCLDQLASQGINFTQAISNYPVSSPARAILMTGLYPIQNKVTSNCNSETEPYDVELSKEARCWSDVLKDQGYETGYIGKWHLDAPRKPYVNTGNNKGELAWNEWCSPDRRHGFDYWLAYGTYDQHLRPMYWNKSSERENFFYVDQWGPEYEADHAIEYIRNSDNKQRNSDKPFALVVSMNPPHMGYELVPDKYKKLYANYDVDKLAEMKPNVPKKGTKFGDHFRKSILNYYACMSGVDEQVGRIIAELKERNLFDNTIVVFTSDHGDCMGAHNEITKNNLYEESIRIPIIITYPEKIKPRVDSSLMISFSDLYPSLLTLMGFKEQIPSQVQTNDLSTSIVNPEITKKLTQPYYKIDPADLTTGYRGLRTDRYTFVFQTKAGKITQYYLFDRKDDPWQLNNIADRNQKKVKELSTQLKQWLNKTNDPFVNFL